MKNVLEIENYIKRYFNYNSLNDNFIYSSLNEYSVLELVMDLENDFDVEFNEDEFTYEQTILDFINLTNNKIKAKNVIL